MHFSLKNTIEGMEIDNQDPYSYRIEKKTTPKIDMESQKTLNEQRYPKKKRRKSRRYHTS